MNYFLTLDGIPGASSGANFKNWIELEAFETSTPITSKSSFFELDVTLKDSTALTSLMEKIGNGKSIGNGQMFGVVGGSESAKTAQTEIGFALSDILVTEVRQNANGQHVITLGAGSAGFGAVDYGFDGAVASRTSSAWNFADQVSSKLDPLHVSASGTSGNLVPSSATEYFIAFDGLESARNGGLLPGWFAMDGFDFALSRPTDSSGSSSSKLQAETLSLDMDFDSLMPHLLRASSTGTLFKGVEIKGLMQTGGESVVTHEISLRDVRIDDLDFSAESFGETIDTLELFWGALSVETFSLDPSTSKATQSGPVFSFDKVLNKAFAVDVYDAPSMSGAQSSAPGGLDYYLSFHDNTIAGPSLTENFEGAFRIESYAFTTDGARITDFTVEFGSDTGLVDVFRKAANNETLQHLSIVGLAPTGKGDLLTALELDLRNVAIQSIDEDSNGGHTLELDFEAFHWENTKLSKDGSTDGTDTFGFDQRTGKEIGDFDPPLTAITPATNVAGQDIDYYLSFTGAQAPDAIPGGSYGFKLLNLETLAKFSKFQSPDVEFGFEISGNDAFAQLTAAMNKDAAAPDLQIFGVMNTGAEPHTSHEYRFNEVLLESITTNGDSVYVSFSAQNYGLKTAAFGKDATPAEEFSFQTGEVVNFDAATDVQPSGKAGTVETYFVSFDSIGGDGANSGYENWIELESMSLIQTGPRPEFNAAFSPTAPDVILKVASLTGLTELLAAHFNGTNLAGFQIEGIVSQDKATVTSETHAFETALISSIDVQADGSYQVALSAVRSGSEIIPTSLPGAPATSFGYDYSTSKAIPFLSVDSGNIGSDGFRTDVADDLYIRFDGIDGESAAKGYGGWNDVLGFEFSSKRPAAGSIERGAAPSADGLDVSTVVVELAYDTTAPLLAQHVFTGKTLELIELDFVGQYSQDFGSLAERKALDMDLRNAKIESSQMVSAGDDVIHRIEISFDQIIFNRFETTPVVEPSQHEFGWDIRTNEDITNGGGGATLALTDSDARGDAVFENAAIGALVGIDIAADVAASFALSNDAGGLFAIDPLTGVVRVAGAIDRETTGATQQITVEATTTSGATGSRTFTIAIGDENEFDVTLPEDTNPAANSVTENADIGQTLGVTMFSSDADATQNAVSYSLVTDPARIDMPPGTYLADADRYFAIDPESGALSVAGPIDFETLGRDVNVPILARSADGSEALVTIAVQILDEGGISVVGTNGTDRLDGGTENDTITGFGARDVILGFAGDDLVRAGGGYDRVLAGDGNDSVYGENGSDYAQLGRGADFYNDATGQTGLHAQDTVLGGDGNDTINTRGGDDLVDGGRNNDRIFLGYGDDTAQGGGGNDMITASRGQDVVRGGDGNDLLYLGDDDDVAFGGRGSDTGHLGTGNDFWYDNGQTTGHDRVFGGTGQDWIEMGGGNDTATGGADADTFVLSSTPGHDEITDFELGVDQVFLSSGLMDTGSDTWEDYVDLGQSHMTLLLDGGHTLTFSNLTVGDDLTGSIFLLSEVVA